MDNLKRDLYTYRYIPKDSDISKLGLSSKDELKTLIRKCMDMGFLKIKELGTAASYVLPPAGHQYVLEK